MSNRIIHFEIPMDDPARATNFYSEMFGWEINKWGGPTDYWTAKTGEGETGINGALLPRGGPTKTVVNTVGVENLDAALEKLLACGGTIEMPKINIAGVGDFAYCRDTEGNVFGMIENTG